MLTGKEALFSPKSQPVTNTCLMSIKQDTVRIVYASTVVLSIVRFFTAVNTSEPTHYRWFSSSRPLPKKKRKEPSISIAQHLVNIGMYQSRLLIFRDLLTIPYRIWKGAQQIDTCTVWTSSQSLLFIRMGIPRRAFHRLQYWSTQTCNWPWENDEKKKRRWEKKMRRFFFIFPATLHASAIFGEIQHGGIKS